MGRRSKVRSAPDALREAVDAAIRAGWTVDEIHAEAERVAGEIDLPEDEIPSRSSLGRYRASVERQMEHYRQAQQLASVWAEQLPDNGDVAQLTRQVLSTLAFQAAGQMSDDEDINGKEVAWLARALKDIAMSSRMDVETRAKIKAEAAEEAAEEAAAKLREMEHEDAQGGARTLDPETLRRIREEVYGIVDGPDDAP